MIYNRMLLLHYSPSIIFIKIKNFQLPQSNSFVSDHARTKSPLGPCLTSTPVSEMEQGKGTNGSCVLGDNRRAASPDSDTGARKVRSTTLELGPQDSNWTSPKSKKSNKGPPPKPPVRFRTTALRNQHQRWSFAELSGQVHGHGVYPGVPQPGYPQAPPHTCGYQGPGSNGSGSL